MTPGLVEEYATEGGVLLVADLTAAADWRGTEDDGSGVTVEYMGPGLAKLPEAMLASKKPGRQSKTFDSLDEARAFEREVIAEFEKSSPEAARLPDRLEHPAYYVGDARVFYIEVTFNSMLDGMLGKIKGGAQVLVFDKKRKAQGVFMVQEDAGRGVIAADAKAGVLAVVKFHSGAPPKANVARVLGNISAPRSKITIALDGHIMVFDTAFSSREIAEANWKSSSLVEAANLAFEGNAGGPLRIPDQKFTAGAFVRIPAGTYALSYKPQVDVAGAGAAVMWLTRV